MSRYARTVVSRALNRITAGTPVRARVPALAPLTWSASAAPEPSPPKPLARVRDVGPAPVRTTTAASPASEPIAQVKPLRPVPGPTPDPTAKPVSAPAGRSLESLATRAPQPSAAHASHVREPHDAAINVSPPPAPDAPVVVERTDVTLVERTTVVEREVAPVEPAPRAAPDRRYVVRWDDPGAPLTGPLRTRAERSIVERAREEVRRRIAADPAAASAPIEITVQNVTVRADPPPPVRAQLPTPAPSPAPAPAVTAPVGSLLRRSVSHGF